MPAELLPKYTTIEYTLSRPAQIPPIFLFVIDTCLDEDDLKALKETIVVSLSLLPPNALVGLITYGTMVSLRGLAVAFRSSELMILLLHQAQVHELAYGECPKSYVFRGSKDYQQKQIVDMLGLNPSTARPAAAGPSMPGQRGGFQAAASRFLMPVQACEFQLTQIIESLTRDPWPVANDRRPMRCTGVAMNVAVSMLEVSGAISSGEKKRMLIGFAINPVGVPEYRGEDHAVCRWACHRRSRHGRWTGTQGAHPISPRYRSRQCQAFQESDQGI